MESKFDFADVSLRTPSGGTVLGKFVKDDPVVDVVSAGECSRPGSASLSVIDQCRLNQSQCHLRLNTDFGPHLIP